MGEMQATGRRERMTGTGWGWQDGMVVEMMAYELQHHGTNFAAL